jgi:hypothetical protein
MSILCESNFIYFDKTEAIFRNHTDYARFLIDKGANISIVTKEGMNALHYGK